MDKAMKNDIARLGHLFSEIVDNYNSGNSWKNTPLAKEAFELMQNQLPLRVKGELTPYSRVVLLNKMLECLSERSCPRFFLSVREYQLSMFPLISDKDIKEDMDVDEYEDEPEDFVREVTVDAVKKAMKRTQDFLNPKMSMEKWCKTYDVHLKFDPVERSERWEEVIYDVETECEEILKDERKGMGFCYLYWSTKKSVLAKYGIDWSSPSVMNPHVIFD